MFSAQIVQRQSVSLDVLSRLKIPFVDLVGSHTHLPALELVGLTILTENLVATRCQLLGQ